MIPDPSDAVLDALVGVAVDIGEWLDGAVLLELQNAGLLSVTSDGVHELTQHGRAAVRAGFRRRRAHVEEFPFGGVTVTAGPFAGQAGYYDEDVDVGTAHDADLLEGWTPGARAVVYLFSRGEPLVSWSRDVSPVVAGRMMSGWTAAGADECYAGLEAELTCP